MLLSVIFPSRGRIEKLAASVDSLLSLATRPNQIEVLVRMDKDDPTVGAVVQSLPATIIVGERLNGYWSMDTFWNELGRLAQGEWFVTWNDDTKMRTPGWDEIIRSQPPAAILIPEDNSTTYGWPAFPIINRKVQDRLGHLTRFPGIDTWMHGVIIAPGTWPTRRVPIIIEHERPNNPNYAHLNDNTWKESQFAEDQLCVSWERDWADKWEPLVELDRIALGEF